MGQYILHLDRHTCSALLGTGDYGQLVGVLIGLL
jgi:hypothetical protein